jgi:hypothetical protein
LRSRRLVDIGTNHPVPVEWLDAPGRVDAIWPALEPLVRNVVVMRETVDLLVAPPHGLRRLSPNATVAGAMQRAVAAVDGGALLSLEHLFLTARPPKILVVGSVHDPDCTINRRPRAVTFRRSYAHLARQLLLWIQADREPGRLCPRQELFLSRTDGRRQGQEPARQGIWGFERLCERISLRAGVHFSPHMLRHTLGGNAAGRCWREADPPHGGRWLEQHRHGAPVLQRARPRGALRDRERRRLINVGQVSPAPPTREGRERDAVCGDRWRGEVGGQGCLWGSQRERPAASSGQ